MENSAIFKALRSTTHAPINAHFSKNSSDFIVREIPLYEFSGEGEHLVLELQKKDLTTSEALKLISAHTGAKMKDFGFAGLKDKEGMTTQFISMPAIYEEDLETFYHEKIKILQSIRHNNKIKTGHLKGNSFFIRLKKVMPTDAKKLENAINLIKEQGFPNYFGYQRFGKFGDNYTLGEDILKKQLEAKEKGLKQKKKFNPKLNNFLISAFQSHIFNIWLSKRVELSRFVNEFSPKELKKIYGFDDETIKNLKAQKQFFKMLKGDVLYHYPFGKTFLCEDLETELERFNKKDLSVAGLLFGKKALHSEGLAKEIEDEIYKNARVYEDLENGTNRYAWIWADDLEFKYIEEKAWFSFSFTLPKGSYATRLLEEITGQDYKNQA